MTLLLMAVEASEGIAQLAGVLPDAGVALNQEAVSLPVKVTLFSVRLKQREAVPMAAVDWKVITGDLTALPGVTTSRRGAAFSETPALKLPDVVVFRTTPKLPPLGSSKVFLGTIPAGTGIAGADAKVERGCGGGMAAGKMVAKTAQITFTPDRTVPLVAIWLAPTKKVLPLTQAEFFTSQA